MWGPMIGEMILTKYQGEYIVGVVFEELETPGYGGHPELWLKCFWCDGEIDSIRYLPGLQFVPRKKEQKD